MNEIKTLFSVPAAYWDQDAWILEDGVRAESKYTLNNWPRMIGLVSTGLLNPDNKNAKRLLQKNYSLVVVDEAHKAGADYDKAEVGDKTLAYEVLEQMVSASHKGEPVVRSLVLATATPMQLRADDPWVFLSLLSKGDYGQHVLGTADSLWRDAAKSEKMLKGKLYLDGYEKWEWFRNPGVHPVAEEVMKSIEIKAFLSRVPNIWRNIATNGSKELDSVEQSCLENCFDTYAKLHNPFIESTIFRTRKFLEKKIPKIKVVLRGEESPIQLDQKLIRLKELLDAFCAAHKKGNSGSDEFMSSFIHRRWTSSIYALEKSVDSLISRRGYAEDDHIDELKQTTLSDAALSLLFEVQCHLKNVSDLKQEKILTILANEGWDSDKVLMFSESYHTALKTALNLSEKYPGRTIGLYSSESKTAIIKNGDIKPVKRDYLRSAAKNGKIDFLLATKAGQEGLNLQAFGYLINIDIPWNPAHLEQRKGRIQRLGQTRQVIHVYNLWYADSIEFAVYSRVRARLKKFMEFYGVVPETIADANFNEEEIEASLVNPFKLKYEAEDRQLLRGAGLFALSLEQVCDALCQEA